MMYVPDGELCNRCGTFLSWDCSLWHAVTGAGVAYYSCENDACENWGYTEFNVRRD